MEKHFLNPDTLLGRVVSTKDKYQVVHLSLKKGNEVPDFKMEVSILIFVVSGKIRLVAGEEELELTAYELVEMEPGREHKMSALEDSQIFVVKIF